MYSCLSFKTEMLYQYICAALWRPVPALWSLTRRSSLSLDVITVRAPELQATDEVYKVGIKVETRFARRDTI